MTVAIAPSRTFSTREVAAMSGATFRQLDYWVRVRVIRPIHEPPGSGGAVYRRWSAFDVATAMLVRAVMDLGGGTDRARDAVRDAGPIAGWSREMICMIRPGVGYWIDLDHLRAEAEAAVGGAS